MKNKYQLKSVATLLVSIIFITPFSITAFAQEDSYGELNGLLKDVRALYHADKAGIIIHELKMTTDENKAFWTIYNSYTIELKGVGYKMIRLIAGYADNSTKMTDEYADKMITEYLDIESEMLDLLESYIPKFKKVMTMNKVAKLYQIENKLTAVNNLELAASIPMIK